MPAAVVEALIRARLQAFLDDTPPAFTCSVVPANLVALPAPADEAFIVIQYPVVNGSKPVINRHYVEEGGARIVVNTRREIELDEVLALTDDIASLYRDRDLGSGLETLTPSTPIINDVSDDGNWFSQSVIVEYRYQFDD